MNGKEEQNRDPWAEIDPSDEEVSINMSRTTRIPDMTKYPNCKRLAIIASLVERIENLESLAERLESLELYQNKIDDIENIPDMPNLKTLDLAYNNIKKLENLGDFPKLENLLVSRNKISTVENISHLTTLKQLELGSNRIRTVEGIDTLTALEELWFGKNKITEMVKVRQLRILSFQANRLTTWHSSVFDNTSIEELYVSENQLADPPAEIAHMKNLRVLDLGKNVVKTLDHIAKCVSLTDLWLNDNQIDNITQIEKLKDLPHLETLYLERNPLKDQFGPGYRERIISILPQLTQLDALPIGGSINVHVNVETGHKILKK